MRVYVGLGSNLGDREANLRSALDALAAEPGIAVATVSSFRETDPVGLAEQPRFVNAAAALETELDPRALLERLLAVERRLGRTREGPRFGPRTIDLDLLVYGEQRIAERGLEVPHPRLHERRFALEPLAELDPGLVVPGHGRVDALLATLD
jgi:2-amino-4-hydroxy-6-hydroxymethyldihydropteridine diphosphokinase